MSPADTGPLLRAFHGRVERAVLAHGGLLERFMSDGALVIFGVPNPNANGAAAALACARPGRARPLVEPRINAYRSRTVVAQRLGLSSVPVRRHSM